MSFAEHIRGTTNKTSEVTGSPRLMRNVGGSTASKRRLLILRIPACFRYGEKTAKRSTQKNNSKIAAQAAIRISSSVSQPAVLARSTHARQKDYEWRKAAETTKQAIKKMLKKKKTQSLSNGSTNTRLTAEEGELLAFYRGAKLGLREDVQK